MFRKIIFILSGVLYALVGLAQSPDMYPPPVPEAVDVNFFNIILYIVLPVALAAAFFWYQRAQKKKRQKKHKERENETRNKSGKT